MTEFRISQQRMQDLDSDLQSMIRLIVRKYSDTSGYDYEFEYYWANFTEESWLLAQLHSSESCEVLYYGKA